jgi:hypothetical protein
MTVMEKLGIKNLVSRLVCPHIEDMRSELVESKLCVSTDREPNLEILRRRLTTMEKKLVQLEKKYDETLKQIQDDSY